MERVINTQLPDYLEDNQLISDRQYDEFNPSRILRVYRKKNPFIVASKFRGISLTNSNIEIREIRDSIRHIQRSPIYWSFGEKSQVGFKKLGVLNRAKQYFTS